MRSLLLILSLILSQSVLAQDSLKNDSLIIPSNVFSNAPTNLEIKSENNFMFEKILYGYNNPDFASRLAYRLIIILFIIFLTIFLFIFINRVRVEAYKKIKKRYDNRIEELIAEYISLNQNTSLKEIEEIKAELIKITKKRIGSKLILRTILSIDHAFTGESNLHLRALYVSLGYHKKAKSRLKSENWSVRAKAIRELSQMDRFEYTDEIRKSLTHINPVLRLEAGIALLRLDKENPFSLLDIDRELTSWQQVILFDLIKNTSSIKVPNFSKWLTSKQDSIVEFSIKMIMHFQQLESLEKLHFLLQHSSWVIRARLVNCYASLEHEDVRDLIEKLYLAESNAEVRLECIHYMKKLNTKESKDILNGWFFKTNETEEILEITISFRELGESGIDWLTRTKSLLVDDLVRTRAINHALDNNLFIN